MSETLRNVVTGNIVRDQKVQLLINADGLKRAVYLDQHGQPMAYQDENPESNVAKIVLSDQYVNSQVVLEKKSNLLFEPENNARATILVHMIQLADDMTGFKGTKHLVAGNIQSTVGQFFQGAAHMYDIVLQHIAQTASKNPDPLSNSGPLL